MSYKLRQISQLTKQFQQDSRTIKPNEQVIKSIKALMEEIDESIADFKEENRAKLEEFANDEKLLAKELDNYEKKIQSWNSANETDYEPKSCIGIDSNQNQTECNLLKEVVEFDVN